MFLEPPSTRLDLGFRLAGVQVRVHPMFWLIAILLGWRLPIAEQLLFAALAFVSVLTHEMGHALAARWLGARVRVVLHSLGGTTLDEDARPGHGPHHVFVLVAGPLAGCVLALGAWALIPLLGGTGSGFLGALRFHLLWINLVWTLLNVLPIQPLDGGRAAERWLMSVAGDTGYGVSSIVSFASAAVVAVVAWRMSQTTLALFMAYFALKGWEQSL